jgi:hypothetical protein
MREFMRGAARLHIPRHAAEREIHAEVLGSGAPPTGGPGT